MYQPDVMATYYVRCRTKGFSKVYPLAQLLSCSNFKKTHHFPLEAWEAVNRATLAKFFETGQQYI